MTTELLTQLQSLIADAERNALHAALWQETVRLCQEIGYGPRITPTQIVEMLPNLHGINEILAATQEVLPAAAGSKMPRRKLTLEDERVITARSDAGCAPAQIAEDLGIAQKIVRDFIDRTHV
jgi:hypothetical protein